MAFEQYPSSWDAKESAEVLFSENEIPKAEDNYAICKVNLQWYYLIMLMGYSEQEFFLLFWS